MSKIIRTPIAASLGKSLSRARYISRSAKLIDHSDLLRHMVSTHSGASRLAKAGQYSIYCSSSIWVFGSHGARIYTNTKIAASAFKDIPRAFPSNYSRTGRLDVAARNIADSFSPTSPAMRLALLGRPHDLAHSTTSSFPIGWTVVRLSIDHRAT